MCRSGWLWAGIVVAGLTFSCLAVLGKRTHDSNLRLAKKNIQLELSSLASSAASLVDVDQHRRIVDDGGADPDAYSHALDPLRRLQEPSDLAAIYTLVRKGGTISFGYDTTTPGDNNKDGQEDHSAVGEVWDASEIPDAVQRAFVEKVTVYEPEPTTDKWGTWISGFAPVLRPDGTVECVVGVDVAYGRFVERLAAVDSMRLAWLGISAAISLVSGTFAALFFRRLGNSLQDALRSQAEVRARNVELAQLNETLDVQARTDALTGLLNRASLETATYEALGTMATDPEWCVALVFIDLDNFKLVNDSLGHEAGDALLTAVTRKLEELAGGHAVGRFGGDELMVVVQGKTALNDAILLAERVTECLAEPIQLRERVIYVTASIGIAAASGVDQSASDLIRHADAAMYAAKHRGKNQAAVFHNTMMEEVDHRLSIEAGLRDAFGRGHLWLALQPIVELRSSRVVSCEALLRWTRDDGSQVSPADFIPVAEENGMILQIGEWILDNVVALLCTWRDDPDLCDVRIAVNVSARQICDQNFVKRVAERLAVCDVPGRLLTLEITETAVMNDHASLVEQLKQARAAGMTVALDDFGTGYSSLSMLVRTPIDVLKIDKTFVVGLESDRRTNVMTKSIVALSQSMGMKVVAEGVEIPEHAEHLTKFGCELAQGWLYAKAMPEPEFREFVRNHRCDQAA